MTFNLPSYKVRGIIILCHLKYTSCDSVEAMKVELKEGRKELSRAEKSVFRQLLCALNPSHLLKITTSKLQCKTNSVYMFTLT